MISVCSVVDFLFFDSSQAVMGWALARVDRMGFFYLRGDVWGYGWGEGCMAGRNAGNHSIESESF